MPNYSCLETLLNKWEQQYPWAVAEPLGASVLGNPLRLFKIGTGPIDIQLNAAMHANEWLTAFALARFGMRLCQLWQAPTHVEDRLWTEWLQRYTLWLIPLVNPDGVEIVMDGIHQRHPYYAEIIAMNKNSTELSGWKANIRGVDLNDQFPAGWEVERERRLAGKPSEGIAGVVGPAPRDYGGREALTEPEAQALANLVEQVPFEAVLALHSQGEEIYYNYCDLEPVNAHLIAQAMAQASGYRAVRLEASDAGFKDWFIQATGRYGFTIELGNGCNPLPWLQRASMTDCLQRMVCACLTALSSQRDH